MSASAPRVEAPLVSLHANNRTLSGEALLTDTVRFCDDLRRLLDEALLELGDRTNFAGAQRFSEDPVPLAYRYHEASDLWVSDTRAIFPFGSSIMQSAESAPTSSWY